MGLDNGITLRLKKDSFTIKETNALNKFNVVGFNSENENTFDIDLLYWRKCWNIRGEIFDFLADNGYNVNNDTYEYDLSIDMMLKLAKRLESILKPSWWSDNCDSIWSWDECGKNYIRDLKSCIKALKALKKMNKSEDSYRIFFYDSY